MLYPLQALGSVLLDGDASRARGYLISAAIFGVLFIPGAAFAMSVRASATGIHRLFGEHIPWTSIVSASRRGSLMRYEATVGVDGRAVPRSFRLSRRLNAALREWLAPDHPLVKALDQSALLPSDTSVADGTTLRVSREGKYVLAGCFVFFVAVGCVSAYATEGWVAIFYAFFWGAWVLLCAYGLLEAQIESYEVRGDRFLFRSLFTRAGSTAWSDIAKIEHSLWSGGWITVRNKSGTTVRVGCGLEGVSVLAHALLQRCPSADVSPSTRQVLTRLALGEQRPVWGLANE